MWGGGGHPVVSGCCSNTLGLSGLLSDVVESTCQAVSDPLKVISSEELLGQITEFNKKIQEKLEEDGDYDWRMEYVLLGTDVVGLFPIMSADWRGEALRRQLEASKITWKDIDEN